MTWRPLPEPCFPPPWTAAGIHRNLQRPDAEIKRCRDEAVALIRELDLERDVITLGSVWEQLPCLYAVAAVYCTPSVMEGFGMSAQEAAATSKPVVSSDLVPYTREYLLGGAPDALIVVSAEVEPGSESIRAISTTRGFCLFDWVAPGVSGTAI